MARKAKPRPLQPRPLQLGPTPNEDERATTASLLQQLARRLQARGKTRGKKRTRHAGN